MTSHVLRMDEAGILVDLEPADVHGQLARSEAILVDVREASEYENERIPGAFLMPLSFFEAEHFPYISGQRVILMCAVGKRSAAAGKQLIETGVREVFHMAGGLTAWKALGLATDTE